MVRTGGIGNGGIGEGEFGGGAGLGRHGGLALAAGCVGAARGTGRPCSRSRSSVNLRRLKESMLVTNVHNERFRGRQLM
jgi:hypothetical protein